MTTRTFTFTSGVTVTIRGGSASQAEVDAIYDALGVIDNTDAGRSLTGPETVPSGAEVEIWTDEYTREYYSGDANAAWIPGALGVGKSWYNPDPDGFREVVINSRTLNESYLGVDGEYHQYSLPHVLFHELQHRLGGTSDGTHYSSDNGPTVAATNAFLGQTGEVARDGYWFPPQPSWFDDLIGDCLDALGQLWDAAKNIFSPLVLDLNGNGVTLTALEGSGAYFDLDADGFAQKTGWVTGGDGLLAIDKNGDGIINDITELFGVAEDYATATTNGFDTLAALDSNLDGKIDAGDALFGSLKVWIDADGDGFTDAGELKSLAELGITSISLNETKQETTNAGNIISHVSGYTKADGTTGTIVDAWFQNSNVEVLNIRPVWRMARDRNNPQMAPEKVELSIHRQLRGGAITNEMVRIAA